MGLMDYLKPAPKDEKPKSLAEDLQKKQQAIREVVKPAAPPKK